MAHVLLSAPICFNHFIDGSLRIVAPKAVSFDQTRRELLFRVGSKILACSARCGLSGRWFVSHGALHAAKALTRNLSISILQRRTRANNRCCARRASFVRSSHVVRPLRNQKSQNCAQRRPRRRHRLLERHHVRGGL